MKMERMINYNNSKLDDSTVWLLFLICGWSYGSMDQMGKQILFWLTLGGFGIWWIYRLFTLSNAIKGHNREVALRCGFDHKEFASLGLI